MWQRNNYRLCKADAIVNCSICKSISVASYKHCIFIFFFLMNFTCIEYFRLCCSALFLSGCWVVIKKKDWKVQSQDSRNQGFVNADSCLLQTLMDVDGESGSKKHNRECYLYLYWIAGSWEIGKFKCKNSRNLLQWDDSSLYKSILDF